MRPTLFISDLHLSALRPEINALFFRFLDDTAGKASALYILGDLFEVWLGDDQLDRDPLARKVADALRDCAKSGVKVFFMHGNRDFLIGERFALAANLTLLDDPTLIALNGIDAEQRVLLLHGDTLCTDDVTYQTFRAQARDRAWQAAVLAKSYAERIAFAGKIREQSTTEKSRKAEDIMDVSAATVGQVFRDWQYPLMIHGHTHRPATHAHEVDGVRCTRIVLADWRDAVEVLSLPAVSQASAKEI